MAFKVAFSDAILKTVCTFIRISAVQFQTTAGGKVPLHRVRYSGVLELASSKMPGPKDRNGYNVNSKSDIGSFSNKTLIAASLLLFQFHES